MPGALRESCVCMCVCVCVCVSLQSGTDLKGAFSAENVLRVQSIVCYSKGFVIGQDQGRITIFEKDEKEYYRRARSFTIENNLVPIRYACTHTHTHTQSLG